MSDDFTIEDLAVQVKPGKERVKSEFRIHVAIFEHVSGRKRRGKEIITTTKAFNAFICHIWQGRSAEDGFFLKMMGVIAGVADFLVLWCSKCECGRSKIGIGFLEVKKPGGVSSTPQRKFCGICHWLGVNYAIVKSVREAHNQLVAWGCPANHNSILEPDLATKAEKRERHDLIYARQAPEKENLPPEETTGGFKF